MRLRFGRDLQRFRTSLGGELGGVEVSDGSLPPLVPLHLDESLLESKLQQYSKLSDRDLIDSLKPVRTGSLKVRPDGTLLDEHHRIRILRDRGIDVNALEREIAPKESIPQPFED